MIKFAKMSTISKIHAKLKPFLNLIKTLRKNSTHSSNKKFCDRYFYTYKTANPVKTTTGVYKLDEFFLRN